MVPERMLINDGGHYLDTTMDRFSGVRPYAQILLGSSRHGRFPEGAQQSSDSRYFRLLWQRARWPARQTNNLLLLLLL